MIETWIPGSTWVHHVQTDSKYVRFSPIFTETKRLHIHTSNVPWVVESQTITYGGFQQVIGVPPVIHFERRDFP